MWMLWGSFVHMVHRTGSKPACSGSQPCLWLSQSHASSAHKSWARRRGGEQLHANKDLVYKIRDIGAQHQKSNCVVSG